MASKKKFEKCRVKSCKTFLPCYEHCQKSENGQHEARPYSAIQGDDSEFLVDYTCKHCGQSGSVQVTPSDIRWG